MFKIDLYDNYGRLFETISCKKTIEDVTKEIRSIMKKYNAYKNLMELDNCYAKDFPNEEVYIKDTADYILNGFWGSVEIVNDYKKIIKIARYRD